MLNVRSAASTVRSTTTMLLPSAGPTDRFGEWPDHPRLSDGLAAENRLGRRQASHLGPNGGVVQSRVTGEGGLTPAGPMVAP
jgi:hypothetical protein